MREFPGDHQWLGLHAFPVEGADSIPGWGTKTLQAVQPKKLKMSKMNFERIKLFPSYKRCKEAGK